MLRDCVTNLKVIHGRGKRERLPSGDIRLLRKLIKKDSKAWRVQGAGIKEGFLHGLIGVFYEANVRGLGICCFSAVAVNVVTASKGRETRLHVSQVLFGQRVLQEKKTNFKACAA